MPDAEDFYTYRLGSERHVVGDLAELAVRLGSPVAYDRRGDVIWYDQFDYEVNNWFLFLGDAGDAVTAVTTYPYIGKYAAKLLTAGAALRGAGISGHLAPPIVNKWGIECAVWFKQDYDSFTVQLIYQPGAVAYSTYVRLVDATGKIEIYDENGAWQEVGVFQTSSWSYALYHHLKLVVDFENECYSRVMLDAQDIDLSAYPLYSAAGGGVPINSFYIKFHGRVGQSDYAQLGYVIVTANEP